ncbi:MAG: hypothetical protein ACKOC5_04650 [Chloroflexota bacterium]
MDEQPSSRWYVGYLKLLGYLALCLVGLGMWGAWHGWRTALQYSDALFYMATAAGALSVAARLGASSSITRGNLVNGSVTGEPIASRMQRGYRDVLAIQSFSSQSLIVAVALFVLSVLISL